MGHHVIMGRKTHESIGKALPGRTNVVITRNPNYESEETVVVHSLEDALKIAEGSGETEAFVIGGAEIFKQALPLADKIYMTKVKASIDGDIFFPEYKKGEWSIVSSEPHKADGKNSYPYEFQTLERK